MRACSTSTLEQGAPAWLEELFCVDEDGNGTVVDQLDGHVGCELAVGHRNSERGQLRPQELVEAARPRRRRGCNERRAPPPPHVAVQGELRNQQERSAGVL